MGDVDVQARSRDRRRWPDGGGDPGGTADTPSSSSSPQSRQRLSSRRSLAKSLACVAPAIRGTSSARATLRDVVASDLVSLPLHVPTVSVLAYVYLTISPWSVALFALPALAAQRLLLLYRQQREASEALGEANARLASANLSFATALVATLDARDRYTAGHSAAVAIYARDIASRMGLAESEQELVHLCGLVHDVGKIGLPASVLEKPGALSLDERREMERHSVIGEEILRNVDDYGEIAGDRAKPSRARRRDRIPRPAGRRRHPAACEDHCRRGRIQRDDLGSTVPRRNAESRRAPSARAGCRESVRYCLSSPRSKRSSPGAPRTIASVAGRDFSLSMAAPAEQLRRDPLGLAEAVG